MLLLSYVRSSREAKDGTLLNVFVPASSRLRQVLASSSCLVGADAPPRLPFCLAVPHRARH